MSSGSRRYGVPEVDDERGVDRRAGPWLTVVRAPPTLLAVLLAVATVLLLAVCQRVRVASRVLGLTVGIVLAVAAGEAAELDRAAAHCRVAAEHFRGAEVPRGAAHAARVQRWLLLAVCGLSLVRIWWTRG